jgi:hypothetical protein
LPSLPTNESYYAKRRWRLEGIYQGKSFSGEILVGD